MSTSDVLFLPKHETKYVWISLHELPDSYSTRKGRIFARKITFHALIVLDVVKLTVPLVVSICGCQNKWEINLNDFLRCCCYMRNKIEFHLYCEIDKGKYLRKWRRISRSSGFNMWELFFWIDGDKSGNLEKWMLSDLFTIDYCEEKDCLKGIK